MLNICVILLEMLALVIYKKYRHQVLTDITIMIKDFNYRVACEHVFPTSTASSPPQALLDDPHPTVRCIATLGVCKILTKCWELLPPVVIVDFLKKLAKDLANDASSDEVRCSVFKVHGALSHPAFGRFCSLVPCEIKAHRQTYFALQTEL